MSSDEFLRTAVKALAPLEKVGLWSYDLVVGAGQARDDQLAARVSVLCLEASPAQRAALRSLLGRRAQAVLGRAGIRAATLALRERSADRLRGGLVALALSGVAEHDIRDFMVSAAIHHDCAGRLGMSRSALFDDAAACAEPSVAEDIRRFGRREDVTLAAFGWREDATEHGPQYR